MSRKELWSGRFREAIDPLFREYSSSPEDAKLLKYDVAGSIAHVRMLGTTGIIEKKEAAAIEEELRNIYISNAEKPEQLLEGEEDIHLAVERMLISKLGDAAARLHTARSRNDQIALDLRLYCRDSLLSIARELEDLERVLLKNARKYSSCPIPSYTHLQRAQPVYLAHYLLAHFWRFERDLTNMRCVFDEINVSPLGAGAAAGTSHQIDVSMTARLLGFDSHFENSLDAVSDRDFILSLLFMLSRIALHLSSFAEELVLWSTSEFSFAMLPDSIATGSSIMPHKKNPDIAELLRGQSAAIISHLFGAMSIVRTLPMGYSRDLQLQKKMLFNSAEELMASLKAAKLLLSSVRFSAENMKKAASDVLTYSVELADELVRNGVPFRKAHEAVGKIVLESISSGRDFLSIVREKYPSLKIPSSVIEDIEMRSSYGSSSGKNIALQLTEAHNRLERLKKWRQRAEAKNRAVERLLRINGRDRA